jgi:hypothetical protein
VEHLPAIADELTPRGPQGELALQKLYTLFSSFFVCFSFLQKGVWFPWRFQFSEAIADVADLKHTLVTEDVHI